jgi:predicted ribosomally synthesized peptide with SipW-like signal peptide
MIKRIMLSLMVIALIGMMTAGGLFAYFSDTETAEDNRITTGGSPELWLNYPGSESDTATWVMDNMVPGVTECHNAIYLVNAGTAALYVDIAIENVCTEIGNEESDTMPDSAEGMDRYIEIVEFEYDGYSLLYEGVDNPNQDDDDLATPWNEVDDINGNDFIDLDDLEIQNPDNVHAPGFPPPPDITELRPPPGPEKTCSILLCMKLRFHESASNEYQGDKVEMTMYITLLSP